MPACLQVANLVRQLAVGFQLAEQPSDTIGPHAVRIEVVEHAVEVLTQARNRIDRPPSDTQDRYEIDVMDTTGTPVASVRVVGEPVPVTDAHVAAFVEQAMATPDPEHHASNRRYFDDLPHAETIPAHGAIHVDGVGNLWVEVYRLPGDDQPRWTVFDPQHRMLGTVAFPQRFLLHQIGSDFVLGRWTDDLSVEHVRVYDLIKPR